VIKTRAHSNSGVVSIRKLFDESNPLIGCETFSNHPLNMLCSIGGHHYSTGLFLFIGFRPRTFIVQVTRTSSQSAASGQFNFYFEIVDQTTSALVSGQTFSDLLERDI